MDYNRAKKEINVSNDILMKVNHIFDDFKYFSDGIRVLFLIHRNKEGRETNNTKVKKIITKNSKEFKTELIRLIDEKERSNLPLRIYSSVNSRNVEKAIRQFKFEQLEADYYDDDSRYGFYYDTKNRFVGALMAPSSRSQSYFLLDIDDKKDIDNALNRLGELNVNIIKSYPSKNGWHIVTDPFNPNLFQVEGVEIKKDGLLLLDY